MAKDYYAPIHTAEHILSGLIVKKLNIERAFSTHIEKKKSKLDFKAPRNLEKEEISDIENEVNRIISLNVDITSEILSTEEAGKTYNLFRIPESANTIRIVSIGEYDSCPCIGEHVSNTSEIDGSLKIISWDYDNEESILRIRFKIV